MKRRLEQNTEKRQQEKADGGRYCVGGERRLDRLPKWQPERGPDEEGLNDERSADDPPREQPLGEEGGGQTTLAPAAAGRATTATMSKRMNRDHMALKP